MPYVLGTYGTDRQLPVAIAVARMYVAVKTDPKAGSTINIIGIGIKRTGPVAHIARSTAIIIRKEDGAISVTWLITCYQETYLTVH